jgi:hypothetical protein
MADMGCRISWCHIGHEFGSHYFPDIPRLKLNGVLLGVDESTTITGVYVRTEKDKWLFDIDNRARVSRHEFETKLEYLLTEMLRDCSVELVVMEEPFRGSFYSSLKSLQSFLARSRAFKGARVDRILTTSWRKGFLRDSLRKGTSKREAAKEATKQEALSRYPSLSEYVSSMKATVDSLEAMGILEGYLAERFDNSGMEKISKAVIDKEHAFWVDVLEASADDWADEIVPKYLNEIAKHGYKQMIFSEDLSLEGNASRATATTNSVVFSEIPKGPETIIAQYRTGKILREGRIFIMVARRKNDSRNLSKEGI